MQPNKLTAKTFAPNIAPHDQVVLFDDVCVLCSAWANFLLRFDKQGKFKLASVQSEAGQAILAHYQQPLTEFTTMYLLHGKLLYSHSTAFVQVIKQLPLPWRIMAMVWCIPRPLRDVMYRFIAKNRYRLFGKRQHCFVPNPVQKQRFL